eukprot:2598073-Alexandrium_andersonii.AAC.1
MTPDNRSLVRNFRRAAGRSMNDEERALLAVQDPLVHHPSFQNVECGDGQGGETERATAPHPTLGDCDRD